MIPMVYLLKMVIFQYPMTDPNGAGIYDNMDPINIPPMNVSIYTSTMDPSWVTDHSLTVSSVAFILFG